MLMDSLTYRVQFGSKPPPLIFCVRVHPIHVDVDIEVPDAVIGFIVESAVEQITGRPS